MMGGRSSFHSAAALLEMLVALSVSAWPLRRLTDSVHRDFVKTRSSDAISSRFSWSIPLGSRT